MVVIDYTSTPLPANGQARSAAALAAIFNNIKTTLDAVAVVKNGNGVATANALTLTPGTGNPGIYINTTAGNVLNAIEYVIGGLSKWRVDSLGNMTGAGITAAAISSTVTNIANSNVYARLMAAQTGAPFLLQNAAATVNLWYVDSLGGMYSAAVVQAVGGFLGNVTGTATSLSGLEASVTGTDNNVTFAAGSFVNAAGAQINVAQTVVSLAASVNAGQNLWVAISLDSAGTYVVTPGTLSGAQTTAVVPAGNLPVRWVLLRAANTQIKLADDSVAGHGYLAARPVASAYGSGGGAGSSLPSAIRATANDAALEDLWQITAQDDTLGRLAVISATQVQLQAGTNVAQNGTTSPLTLGTNNRIRKITAPITWTAAGAAGPRYIIVDLSGAGPGFTAVTTPMPTTNTAGQYQLCLGVVWWDGSAIQPMLGASGTDSSPLFNVTSASVTQLSLSYAVSANETMVTNGGAYTASAGFAARDFYLAQSMKAHVFSKARVEIAMGLTNDSLLSQVRFDTGNINGQGAITCCEMGAFFPSGATATYRQHVHLATFDEVVLAAGKHTVSQDWAITNGITGTFYVPRKVTILLSHA